jgi:hypothetical protein
MLLLLALTGAVRAQSVAQVRLTRVDATAFPEIALNLIIADDALSPVTDPAELSLLEAGETVADLTVTRVPVGVELFLVVDANQSLEVIDTGSELTRLDLARNSIIRYAAEYMNGQGLDRTHVIVPAENGGAFLLQDGAEPVAVLGAINAYEPETLPFVTPLQAMLSLALEEAAQSLTEGRFQALLLYTNGADLDRQLDFPSLTERARALGLPIFVAILGSRADPEEVANAALLYEPTGAFYVHMPSPLDTDPVFTAVQAHTTQAQVRYRSQARRSATIPVEVRVDGQVVTGTFSVTLQPPTISLALDPPRLERVAPAPESALFQLEPAEATVSARVSWPDEIPRALTLAELIVDGVVVAAEEAPQLSAEGELALPWNLRAVDAGTAEVIVQVQDEFGLAARSPEMTVAVTTVWPTPVPTVAPETPAPTPAPAEIAKVVWREIPAWLRYAVVGGGGLLLGGLLVLILVRLSRRRRKPAAARAASTESPTVDEAQLGPESAPEPAPTPRPRRAYLEILANGAPHVDNIVFLQDNVTLGRDPAVAEVVFTDRSVSRLHARIRLSDGRYWLYDEGSAAGTYRNFKRVGLMPQPLATGDEIHLGQVRLRFHWDPGYHLDN